MVFSEFFFQACLFAIETSAACSQLTASGWDPRKAVFATASIHVEMMSIFRNTQTTSYYYTPLTFSKDCERKLLPF